MADYVKMWEDLGMDINNHDNLCQVLPTAVGDVFMTQENRPKAMDFWDMVIAEVPVSYTHLNNAFAASCAFLASSSP